MPIFEDPFFGRASLDFSEASKAWSEVPLVRGIKRPNLLGNAATPQRLKSCGIEEIFCSLRDPVDRTISAAYWYMYCGLVPVGDTNDLLRRALKSAPNSVESELLSFSMYGRNLEHWSAVFPGRVTVFLDKSVRSEPGLCREVVADRLGVLPDSVVSPPGSSAVRNENVYDLKRLQFLSNRFRVGASKTWSLMEMIKLNGQGTRIYQEPWELMISGAVQAVDKTLLKRVMPGSTPTIEPGLIEELRAFFDADLQLLASNFPDLSVEELSPWMCPA